MFKINWPIGVSDPHTCNDWSSVMQYVEDCVKEAVEENEQQILQGEDGEVDEAVYKRYLAIAKPEQLKGETDYWESKILAEYRGDGRDDTFFIVRICSLPDLSRFQWDIEGPDEEGGYASFFHYNGFRVYRRSDFDNFYNVFVGETLVKASATEREMLAIIEEK